jgi:predicted RecB family nuclease
VRLDADTLSLSPSDLTDYLACPHLTQLGVAVARGELGRPGRDDPQGDLVKQLGNEHEARYLQRLRDAGRGVVEIALDDDDGDWDWERAARATEHALRSGVDLVYQACFVDGAWRGLADFVERQADGSYEAVDTKLARRGRPSHVLQLCFYSEQIGRVTGRMPGRLHVELGSGLRESYRVADFLAYYRRVRDRFVSAVSTRPATEPFPCAHCEICDFKERCDAWWDERDHLVRVAGIRRDQIARLAVAGIETLAQLGEAAPGTEVPRMAEVTFAKLRSQAALQLHHRLTGEHRWQTFEPEVERGFGLLPKPSPGDLFFDIEGDPFWEPERGLEYLLGVTELRGGEPVFGALWAHDRDEERRAFEELVDVVHARLREYPGLHVYHYAPYEPSALKRLASAYGTREEELDDLLRREIFVDLYAVVRQGLRISHPRYGLKNVEQFYLRREAELRAGDDSILLYERWRLDRDQAILDAIRDYNEEDCLSTWLLRGWLLERKAEAEDEWGRAIGWREPPEAREPKPEAVELREERDRLRVELLERGETLAARLLDYHRREAKPVWWQFFARLERTSEELVEDAEAIGGLELEAELGEGEYRFRFPVQQHKLDRGDAPIDPATGVVAGTIEALDDVRGLLTLRRGPHVDERALPTALIPGGPFNTDVQQQALVRFARSLAAGDGRYAGLEAVLRREPPLGGERVQVSTLEEAKALVERVEGRHLFVQGPPGSGKTYSGARLIVHLVARGKRVGVSATSHKAIHNLLREVERSAVEAGVEFRGLKRGDAGESHYQGRFVTTAKEGFTDPEVGLIAGTAWLLAREEIDGTLDYLFVDEAGQVSLADAIAMGTAARTLVLLGDPLQLAQVTQGTHPDGSGASVLEHLLGEAQTIPEDRGLFLGQSWRMHPDVCRFVSDAFYESRLEPAPGRERQGTAFGTGLRFLSVEHVANRRESPEEAAAILAELRRLLGTTWTDAEGRTRPLRLHDVLVVAPYNDQGALLAKTLPEGARVGTVDKFQGQEAAVVFFSMTTSSGEDVPRNLDFLFSRNRLNVAVSRARCLAYVVASPRLLEIDCRTIEQMRMANALCLFVGRSSRS